MKAKETRATAKAIQKQIPLRGMTERKAKAIAKADSLRGMTDKKSDGNGEDRSRFPLGMTIKTTWQRLIYICFPTDATQNVAWMGHPNFFEVCKRTTADSLQE